MGNHVMSASSIVRCAFEATGSTSWIMRTIATQGLDRAHGFHLALGLGDDRSTQSRQATEASLIEGRTDLIDTDWLSLARHRRAGIDIAAVFPYGRIMGGVLVSVSSRLHDLADLRGHAIGVVRRNDKNWSVVRSACLRHHGYDPDREAKIHEAHSKTTLLEWLDAGKVDAALVYWHQVPKMAASGRYRQLCDVLDLLEGLGIA